MSDSIDFVPDWFGIGGTHRVAINQPGTYEVTTREDGQLVVKRLVVEERMTGRTDEYDNPIFELVIVE